MMSRQSAPGATDPALALQKLRSLPPLSASTIQILSLTLDSESSLTDLEQVFRSDPGLTADLLKTANSAAFGVRARVSTILHALAILGLDRVRSLATTVAMAGYIRAHITRHAAEQIWAHAVATGVIAELLAKYSDVASGSLLYTSALMHDLGRLGLLANVKEPYQKFLETEFLSIEESEEFEKHSFGITHTRAGEFLAETWGLPLILGDCCRNHHDVNGLDEEEIRIVQTACIIADALGYPELCLQERAKSVAADIWLDEWAGNSAGDSIKEKIRAFSL
jgi:HD-like signal output (HDOD) protein